VTDTVCHPAASLLESSVVISPSGRAALCGVLSVEGHSRAICASLALPAKPHGVPVTCNYTFPEERVDRWLPRPPCPAARLCFQGAVGGQGCSELS
jgi:hypothetical protein